MFLFVAPHLTYVIGRVGYIVSTYVLMHYQGGCGASVLMLQKALQDVRSNTN